MIYRYENPELFDDYERPDYYQYSGKLVLWGAGKLGSVTAHVLAQKGIDFLAFVDIHPQKQGTVFYGRKVITPEELYSIYPDKYVIVTTALRREVTLELKAHNITALEAWPLLLEFDWDGYKYMNILYMARMVDSYLRILVKDFNIKSKYFVDTIRVNTTNRCSLRCENCAILIPYIEKPRDFDFDETFKDTVNVIRAIGDFRELGLFGGEPLLHCEITKYISAFRDIKCFKKLNLTTNGTILPDRKTILAMKAEPRFYMCISDYGIISEKKNELVKLLEMNNISCQVIDYKSWYRKPEIHAVTDCDESLRNKFTNCMRGCYPTISNGKIFLCSLSMTVCEMGILPESNNNYLDLVGLRDAPESMRNNEICKYIARMYNDDYIDACKYCSGKASGNALGGLIPPAVQAKGKLKLEPIIIN